MVLLFFLLREVVCMYIIHVLKWAFGLLQAKGWFVEMCRDKVRGYNGEYGTVFLYQTLK